MISSAKLLDFVPSHPPNSLQFIECPWAKAHNSLQYTVVQHHKRRDAERLRLLVAPTTQALQ